MKRGREAGSIELIVIGLLAALMVVLAFPLFDPTEEPSEEAVLKGTVTRQK